MQPASYVKVTARSSLRSAPSRFWRRRERAGSRHRGRPAWPSVRYRTPLGGDGSLCSGRQRPADWSSARTESRIAWRAGGNGRTRNRTRPSKYSSRSDAPVKAATSPRSKPQPNSQPIRLRVTGFSAMGNQFRPFPQTRRGPQTLQNYSKVVRDCKQDFPQPLSTPSLPAVPDNSIMEPRDESTAPTVSLTRALHFTERQGELYVRTQPSSGNSPAPHPRRKSHQASQAPRRCYGFE